MDLRHYSLTYPRLRLVNPYVQPVLYIRTPEDDNETTVRFADDDPFFSEVSNLIDIIEDIEEDPEAAQILSTYDGEKFLPLIRSKVGYLMGCLDAVRTYEFTWAIRKASERSREAKLKASAETAAALKAGV
jgi:hypothetical protein